MKVSGSSNAELISIETGNDGVGGCVELKKNSENIFTGDVLIWYFSIHDSTYRKFDTVITAYSSRDKPNIVFCDAIGSGKTLTHELISPFLKRY